MNLIHAVDEGKQGLALGMSTGLESLDIAMNGFPRKFSIALGAEPKVGKSLLNNLAFVINPILEYGIPGRVNLNYEYFSTEMDRISTEAKFACNLFSRYHSIRVSKDYLLGRLMNPDTKEVIKITTRHYGLLKEIYYEFIVPMFGRYCSRTGRKLEQGIINFHEYPMTPHQWNSYLMNKAHREGEFVFEKMPVTNADGTTTLQEMPINYKPEDDNQHTIVIIDHIRGFRKPNGWSMKAMIDEISDLHIPLRNICGYSFVFVCHLNRSTSDVNRMKWGREELYPIHEDFKDSGNLAESCSAILTMFNPADDKYQLNQHFGEDIHRYRGNYRTLHLVASRDTEAPQHLKMLFDGMTNHMDVLGNYEHFERISMSGNHIPEQ